MDIGLERKSILVQTDKAAKEGTQTYKTYKECLDMSVFPFRQWNHTLPFHEGQDLDIAGKYVSIHLAIFHWKQRSHPFRPTLHLDDIKHLGRTKDFF